ncbi:hypothetical protein KFL_006070060 [Klebsormidium nitens]|uniref:Uncharacterized protein n=1 Tax=Klebsormidium nitens TaxID=105231 RepID=A0A1Y1IH10_KLENI|nr:hypothetical protein KFL_006070060 [Klebsormidium nitens]|eukprot:GAQ90164.1 hypothetical protein KFL_006070060 [Klebsormidium nitens]
MKADFGSSGLRTEPRAASFAKEAASVPTAGGRRKEWGAIILSTDRLMSYDLGLHYLSEEEVDFDVPPIEFAKRQPSPGPLNNAPELLQAFADDGDVINDDLLRRVVEIPVLALAAPEAEATSGRADGGAAGDVFVADSGELACCHPQEKFFFFLSGEIGRPDVAEISPTLKM